MAGQTKEQALNVLLAELKLQEPKHLHQDVPVFLGLELIDQVAAHAVWLNDDFLRLLGKLQEVHPCPPSVLSFCQDLISHHAKTLEQLASQSTPSLPPPPDSASDESQKATEGSTQERQIQLSWEAPRYLSSVEWRKKIAQIGMREIEERANPTQAPQSQTPSQPRSPQHLLETSPEKAGRPGDG